MSGREHRRGGPGDRGSATVWTAMAAAGMCAVFAAVLTLGQVVVARHLAAGGADLAALAAAGHALEGQGPACRIAERVAAAQDVRIVRCAVRGEVADLTAETRFGPFAPRIRSRAGPPQTLPRAPRAPPPEAS